jgi:hypothetical protein
MLESFAGIMSIALVVSRRIDHRRAYGRSGSESVERSLTPREGERTFS